MTTMRRWGEEVVSLSLRGHGYGDEDDDRPEKPRRYGVTEMRSPIYSFRPTHDALQEILGSLGPFVHGLKFSGGSHSLMGKELVREITDLAHKHDIYVSTGDWAEHLLRQGPSTFKQYVEECRALGFDTIELNAGSLKLPEEALLRLVHLIKNSGLRAKPLFSVKFDSSDIPASGDRAFGAYMAPVKHNSERVDNVDLLIRRAERCLEAGAYMVMIDADDVCQRADSLRADIIAKIVGRLGLEKTMFEASNANTSEWFVRRYGPRVNLFVDHSEVMNLERLRGFNMHRSNLSLLASPFFLNIQHRRRAKETWCKSKMGSTGGGSLDKESAPVCVMGATGYVGSWLIRTLLRRGYRVHATARDPGKAWQVLSAVEGKERLRMFRADMGEEGSFDEAVRGCVALFHVAASMELHVSPDQHNVVMHPSWT